MTNKSPFEIPDEMRSFAERSVEQARTAFEGFVGVAQKTVNTFDGAANTTQGNVKAVGSRALTFAEQNVAAAFELAHKLVKAKDPQEAVAIQSDYLKNQLAALQEQAKEIGALIQKNATPNAK